MVNKKGSRYLREEREVQSKCLCPTNIALTGARKEVSRVTVDQREIVLYTADRSLRSWRAKRLLARRGYHFEVVRITNDGLRASLKRLRSNDYRQTVPYLYVDNRPVGGWGDIKALDSSGTLELLVRGEVKGQKF